VFAAWWNPLIETPVQITERKAIWGKGRAGSLDEMWNAAGRLALGGVFCVVLLTCFCSVYLLNDGYDGYPLRENVTRFPGAQDWRRMCFDWAWIAGEACCETGTRLALRASHFVDVYCIRAVVRELEGVNVRGRSQDLGVRRKLESEENAQYLPVVTGSGCGAHSRSLHWRGEWKEAGPKAVGLSDLRVVHGKKHTKVSKYHRIAE
jgi:hypothetical protein